MRILPAGVDARDVLLCQWLQVAHRGCARNARRNTIPAPAMSLRALSRFSVSDAVVTGLTDGDRTPWARMLPRCESMGGAVFHQARTTAMDLALTHYMSGNAPACREILETGRASAFHYFTGLQYLVATVGESGVSATKQKTSALPFCRNTSEHVTKPSRAARGSPDISFGAF